MPGQASGQFLGATARWAAAVRAKESARADRLFDDPWAAELAGQQGKDWIERRPPESLVTMILRTRSFDDWLRRVTAEHPAIRQVVLMAAGLDTRAFRLDWPAGTRIFELDQPEVLDDKAQILRAGGAEAHSERHAIGVDLAGPWNDRLLEAGFEAERPSTWLLAGAPWIGTMDDPVAFLAARGWTGTLSRPGRGAQHPARLVCHGTESRLKPVPSYNWRTSRHAESDSS